MLGRESTMNRGSCKCKNESASQDLPVSRPNWFPKRGSRGPFSVGRASTARGEAWQRSGSRGHRGDARRTDGSAVDGASPSRCMALAQRSSSAETARFGTL